jgi:hypothetical protein
MRRILDQSFSKSRTSRLRLPTPRPEPAVRAFALTTGCRSVPGGLRPAGRPQPRADPGDVGLKWLLVDEVGDCLADRVHGGGVTVRGQLVGDLRDFLGGQFPREKREQWEVVMLGNAFGITGPQELHDRGDQRRQGHDVVSATVIRRPRCRGRGA